MEKIRGFEVAKGFENKEINLPEKKKLKIQQDMMLKQQKIV